MADITCAKCGEPWDAYGVNHHTDMRADEAIRFKKGQGCPSCKFGTVCTSCDGHGRDTSGFGCESCRDSGIVLAWQPRQNARGFSPERLYTGYYPKVREVTDPGFDDPVMLGARKFPERAGSFQSADGWVDQWWVPCPQGCARQGDVIECGSCKGTGKPTFTKDEVDDIELAAARSHMDASDEDGMDILAERGLI